MTLHRMTRPHTARRTPHTVRDSALHLDGLVAVRGTPLFAPLTLSLQPGTLLGVVGPNGTGKSSLLGAIAGTGVPHHGHVSYGATPLTKLSSRNRAATLALMTQESTAPNELRAIDVVRIGAHASAGARDGTATARARDALERLGAEHLADRVCSSLSGGQRQLVQVARVLAQAAPVMLLDEPTSALDLGHQLAVMHALRECAASGHIVVVTMHDLTQALRWSTMTALVAAGIVATGDPESIITADAVRRAYGVETEIFASPTGSPTLSLVTPAGQLPLALAEPHPSPTHHHTAPRRIS